MRKSISPVARSISALVAAMAFVSSMFAQEPSIGVLPGGPGGQDVPITPPSRPDPLPPFYNPDLPVRVRVNDLVSRLELEEKVALMQMASPSIPRLGIAPFHWWTEALHGMTHDLSTVFPQAIGMAASWDTDLLYEVSTAISTEGRAKNREYRENNIFNAMTGLDFWSPNINIFRDARWGRGQETYGEDPYLTSRFAISFVKGIQGDHPFYYKAIATPKHFAVHSGPEAVREEFNAVVTDQDLYTTYLPQFEAAVKEGKAYSVMSAYNALNGVPASGNKRLLTDILRDQWGFKGYVVSDVDSVADIYQQNHHGYVETPAEASALAIKAGNELNSGTTYGGARNGQPSNLAKAVQDGLITEKEVNTALGKLLEARFRMGEFDPPGYEGNPYNEITTAMYNTPEHHELALKAAQKSMVLLRNAEGTLPLKTDIGTIAVIGPNADNITMQYGNYNGEAPEEHQITILDGIKKAVGADRVVTTSERPPLTGNIALAELVDAEHLFTDASKSTHGLTVSHAADATGLAQSATTTISETGALAKPQDNFDPAMVAKMTGILVPPATGEYLLGAKGRDGFRISIDGEVVVDEMQGSATRTAGNLIHLEEGKSYSILVEFSHTATTTATTGPNRGGPQTSIVFTPNGGGAPAGFGGGGPAGFGRGGRGGRGGQAFGATTEVPGVVAGTATDSDPLLQLAWTRPTADGLPANTAGQSLYAEATELVKKADAVVLVVGIDGSQEGEMRDRSAIELPMVQEGLVRAATIAAGDKPVIVVNCSGSPIALNWANDHASAIVQAWYPGQRGDAVADVLFGKVNPAGRLPVTFYKATSDLPPFTDYAMYNRTYRYDTQPVLYPFGHGLSYSSFEYANLDLPRYAKTGEDVKISFDVKNTSMIDGEEVVQCYINRNTPVIDAASMPAPEEMSDEQATLAATPRKTLVGFARVPLKAGEIKNVVFTVTPQQLSLVVGKDGAREVRPERLLVQVGGSSVNGDGTLTQDLLLEGSAVAPEYRFEAPVIR